MPTVRSRLVGAFVLLVVLSLAGLVVGSADHCRQTQDCTGYHRAYKKPTEQILTSDEQIALYTRWLALFTGALAIVSMWQGIFLIRADRTANTTADAARVAAEAAMTQAGHMERYTAETARLAKAAEKAGHVERAWVFFEGINIQRPLYATVGGIASGPGIAFSVTWHNGGRTPATNVQLYMLHKIIRRGRPVPEFDTPTVVQSLGIVGQNKSTSTFSKFVSDFEWMQIRRKSRTLYIYSRAEYFDVFDKDVMRVSEFTAEVMLVGKGSGVVRASEDADVSDDIPRIHTAQVGVQNRCT